jgi:subtilisin family serine protease
VLIGYCSFGPLDEEDLPITLEYEASGFSYPNNPHNYVLDCTVQYEEDPIAEETGCTLGGLHLDAPSCNGMWPRGPGEATYRNPNEEIIVMFEPGAVTLPSHMFAAPVDQVIYGEDGIRQTLEEFQCLSIAKAFPSFDAEERSQILPDGREVLHLDWSRVYVVRIPEGAARAPVIDALCRCRGVLFAEPNATAIADCVPGNSPRDGDFQAGLQWGLYNCADSTHDINALGAWTREHGSAETNIAIVDWSVWGNHRDLYGKVWGDTFSGGTHGTHVACIAAANEYWNVVGVDWHASILNKDITECGLAEECLALKIRESVLDEADIINCSWSFTEPSILLRDAFALACKMDRVCVSSAFDHPEQGPMGVPYYPQGFGYGVIGVAATDDEDVRPAWSNWGTWIDVAAPGKDIWSCYPVPPYKPEPTSGWMWSDGTSMAAPFVSGLAGLLLSFGCDMDLHNDDIEHIIELSAEDVNSDLYPGWDPYLGAGRIDAHTALEMIAAPCTLFHDATQGQAYELAEADTILFFSTPGLDDGPYAVKRYEVTSDVQFPTQFAFMPSAWGTGYLTNGFSDADTNFGMGWCEPIAGSVTRTGASLRTNVYEVWELDGTYEGYIPCAPLDAILRYSVCGLPGRIFYDDCGSITNEAHLAQGYADTCSGLAPIEERTVRFHTNEVQYHYPDLDPRRVYEITVMCYGCIEGLDVCQSLWVDDVQLHGAMQLGLWRWEVSYTIDPVVYDDGEFTLRFKKETLPGSPLTMTVSTASWIRVEERGFLTEPVLDVHQNGWGRATATPEAFGLGQNYPNPFNPSTTVAYWLPYPSHVTMEIFDVQGRSVDVIVNERRQAGHHWATWNAASLPSGVYFCRMKAGDFKDTRKMVLMR